MSALRVIPLVTLLLATAIAAAISTRTGVAQNEPRPMKIIQRLEHRAALQGIAWSASGAKLATLSDFGQVITVWDTRTWKREREITQYSGAYVRSSIAFVHDNEILTSAGAKSNDERVYSLNLWDADTGALIRRIPGPPISPGDRRPNQAGTFVLSKSGSLLAMSFDHFSNKLVIFRTSDWALQTVLNVTPSESSMGNVSAFAFSPSENEIAIGTGRELRLMDIQGNSIRSAIAYEKFGLLAGPVVVDLKYSPDGSCLATAPNFFSSQDSGAVRIWRSGDTELLNKLSDAPNSIRMIDWSADGAMLAAADEGNFGKVWAIGPSDKNARLAFQFPVEIAGAIKFGPEGKLAATSGKTLLILE